MSPIRFRPELRMPWQALAAFAAVIYVIESAMRSWDFRPTTPDLIVYGAFTLILVLRPLVTRFMKDDE